MGKHTQKLDMETVIRDLPEKGAHTVDLKDKRNYDTLKLMMDHIIADRTPTSLTYQDIGSPEFALNISEPLIAALKKKVVGTSRSIAAEPTPTREEKPEVREAVPSTENVPS